MNPLIRRVVSVSVEIDSEKLRELKQKNEMTIGEIARLTGFGAPYICHLLYGRQKTCPKDTADLLWDAVKG